MNKANVALIGFVDSGKSTLIGHLMIECGVVSTREQENITNIANMLGKASFRYAFLIDRLKIERERGITIRSNAAFLQTQKRNLSLLNLPGYGYAKHFIAGLAAADIAVLCVPAPMNEFQIPDRRVKQLKLHVLIAKKNAIKQLIVAINKMDLVNYSEERFNEAKTELLKQLQKLGYSKNRITFIPISAWCGDNLLVKSEKMTWWKGETFIELLENMPVKREGAEKPLRIPIADVFNLPRAGTVVTGTIVSGTLRVGMMVSICPTGTEEELITEVQSIEQNHKSCDEAGPGDIVGISLSIQYHHIIAGFVIGETNNEPPALVERFEAQIVVVNCPKEIRRGYSPIVDCHTCHIVCRFEELISKMDKARNDVVTEENPPSLKQGDHAIVTLVPKKPMCVETFNNCARMGSISIRDGQLVAIGIILSVNNKRTAGSLTKGVTKRH